MGDAGLGQAFESRPDAGGRGVRTLAPLAGDEPGEAETVRPQQTLPDLLRPLGDRLQVAAHAALPDHGEDEAAGVRHGDLSPVHLGPAVGAVTQLTQSAVAQQAEDGARAPLAILFHAHPHAGLRQELLQPALGIGGEQRGRPARGRRDAIHGPQAQALPALPQPALGVHQLEVVDEIVAVAAALAGGEHQGSVGGEAGGDHPVDPSGQQGLVGDAGLDAVDGGVARSRIAQQQTVGQVAAEPGSGAVRRDVGQAFGGPQPAVARDAAEASTMEEDAAIEIARWIEGHPGDVPGSTGPERDDEPRGEIGDGAEAADSAEMIRGEAGRLVAQHDLHGLRRAHQSGDAEGRRPPGRHGHGALEDHVLEDGDLIRRGPAQEGPRSDRGLRHGLHPQHGSEQGLAAEDVISEMGVGICRDLGVHHQLDAGDVDPRPFQIAQ